MQILLKSKVNTACGVGVLLQVQYSLQFNKFPQVHSMFFSTTFYQTFRKSLEQSRKHWWSQSSAAHGHCYKD